MIGLLLSTLFEFSSWFGLYITCDLLTKLVESNSSNTIGCSKKLSAWRYNIESVNSIYWKSIFTCCQNHNKKPGEALTFTLSTAKSIGIILNFYSNGPKESPKEQIFWCGEGLVQRESKWKVPNRTTNFLIFTKIKILLFFQSKLQSLNPHKLILSHGEEMFDVSSSTVKEG